MSTIDGSAFFLFFLSFTSLLNRIDGVTIHVGAIFSPNTRVGREQKIATEIAVKHFNSSPTLVLSEKELNTSDPLDANSFAQDFVRTGVEAIVATGTWPQVLSVTDVGNRAKTPVLSLTSSSTYSKEFLLQFSFPVISLVRCLADFVKSYSWRQVIVVYENDVYDTVFRSAILLSDALHAVGSSVEYQAVFPPLESVSDPNRIVREELNRMNQQKSTVYLILRSSPTLTVSLFQEATTLGMLNQGYVWICGDEIISLLDSTLSPTFISSYMQGVIGLKTFINESTVDYKQFYTEFQQAYKTEYQNTSEIFFDPGVYAARAYDTMHAIFLARSKSEMNNESLVENLLSTNFVGLSGLVRPITNGTVASSKGNSTFCAVNLIGRSYKELGFWQEGFGFFKDEVQMSLRGPSLDRLRVVYWPGGPDKPPGGMRKLKVGVPAKVVWPGFVNVTYDERGDLINISGFCIDVFDETLKNLEYEIQYEVHPFNGSYDDLVNELSWSFDVVVGDVTIVAHRLTNASFTEPFLTSGLATIVPTKTDNAKWLVTKPFSTEVWLSIVALLVYNSFAIWFFEKDHSDAFHGKHWSEQIGATFWIISTTIFTNYGDGIASYYTKSVIVSWLVVVMVLVSTFTANLSSILVVEKLKPVVNDSKLGCDGGSFVVDYLQTVLNYHPNDIINIPSSNDYAPMFENKTITAAYLEVPYARVFLSQHDTYTIYGETHMLGGFGFALRKASPFTADMSKAILTLQENGAIKRLENTWFSISLSNYPVPDKNINKQSLGIDNFWTLFVLTAGVSTLGLISFFLINNGSTLIRKMISCVKINIWWIKVREYGVFLRDKIMCCFVRCRKLGQGRRQVEVLGEEI